MQKKKKILLLGGSRYLLPLIEAAHKLDIHVITVDFLPNNIAHKYSDEYYNVSIIEKEKVLQVAANLQIDGISSFACDPGVTTAAYVAEKLHLPFQGSYESVSILQDKGRFRAFLRENGFNVPNAKSYHRVEDVFGDIDCFNWPVIVKPVDSAGSKGVTRVDDPKNLLTAVAAAIDNSFNGKFIVEDFIEIQGFRSSADPFSIDGKLRFNFYSDQAFDVNADNPYIPDKIIYPSTMLQNYQDYLTSEINRAFKLLKMRNGIYNIEVCVGKNGTPYIMEITPRGGGNSIAVEQKMAYGIDLVENEVRQAVGMPIVEFADRDCDGYWCNYALHPKVGQVGVFNGIEFDSDFEHKHVKWMDLSVHKGDIIKPFTGAGMCLGDLFLKFNTRDELDVAMANVDEWLKIIVE